MTASEQIITENLDIWTNVIKPRATTGRGRGKGRNSKHEFYGIKKLRELILELATRGLLVPQDSSDEPASELLKKIAVEKDKLIEEKKIKKQNAPTSISDEEKPFDLPEGWEWTHLGDLTEIIRGVTYKKHDANDTPSKSTIPLMRANNIGLNLNFENLIHIPKNIVKEEKCIVKGDVLIAMSSGSANLVGKAAQATENLGNTFGAFCAVIRPVSSLMFPYIGLYCSTPVYRKQTHAIGKGIGIQNLNKTALESLYVPIAPLVEQSRIVAKVDELMALCDELEQQSESSLTTHKTLVETLLGALLNADFEEAWQRIAEHFDILFTSENSIDQLNQTILQLAIMGKLVPQDPNDEQASVLLEKIAKEKEQLIKEGKIKKLKPLSGIVDDEKSFDTPNGWEWARFDDLSLRSEAGWSPSCDPTPREGENWGVLKVSAVTWGKYNPNENKALPDNLKPRPEHEVMPGDFLISRANTADLVARAVVVPAGPPQHLMMSDKIIRFVFSKKVKHEYLKLVNDSSFSREYYARVAGGTSSTMKNVSRQHIRNLVIALPPYSEQCQILAKVDELKGLCDSLKAQLRDAQITQIHLADTTVKQVVN